MSRPHPLVTICTAHGIRFKRRNGTWRYAVTRPEGGRLDWINSGANNKAVAAYMAYHAVGLDTPIEPPRRPRVKPFTRARLVDTLHYCRDVYPGTEEGCAYVAAEMGVRLRK
jgi:hypothetical protein